MKLLHYFMFLSLVASVGAVAQDAQKYSITRIDFTGLQRFTAADVIRVSHLSIGQSVTEKDVATAAASMSTTGLFRNVRYRFTTSTNEIAVTFEIEEERDWSAPVIYDNFIGIDDAELDAAVRELVPAYGRTAPVNSRVPDLITQALSSALRRRGLSGQVTYLPRTKLDGTERKHIFAVDPPPVLCAVHIEGAVAVKESVLLQAVRASIGKPYSRQIMSDLASKTLVKPYRDRGYLSAAFQVPVATLGAAGKCQGALVTVRVVEGPKSKKSNGVKR